MVKRREISEEIVRDLKIGFQVSDDELIKF